MHPTPHRSRRGAQDDDAGQEGGDRGTDHPDEVDEHDAQHDRHPEGDHVVAQDGPLMTAGEQDERLPGVHGHEDERCGEDPEGGGGGGVRRPECGLHERRGEEHDRDRDEPGHDHQELGPPAVDRKEPVGLACTPRLGEQRKDDVDDHRRGEEQVLDRLVGRTVDPQVRRWSQCGDDERVELEVGDPDEERGPERECLREDRPDAVRDESGAQGEATSGEGRRDDQRDDEPGDRCREKPGQAGPARHQPQDEPGLDRLGDHPDPRLVLLDEADLEGDHEDPEHGLADDHERRDRGRQVGHRRLVEERDDALAGHHRDDREDQADRDDRPGDRVLVLARTHHLADRELGEPEVRDDPGEGRHGQHEHVGPVGVRGEVPEDRQRGHDVQGEMDRLRPELRDDAEGRRADRAGHLNGRHGRPPPWRGRG
ncbi:hypothetical protein GALL_362610 [mine drainage metagenome]|uniref:Uncharacterized protein n=1 Tax=mine drainage metagenome TaxID=410659 RepID=A0A1J5QWX2_9ZZZZ